MTKKEIKLKAEKRDQKNSTAAEIRRSGFLPGILYGNETENIAIKIKMQDFEKIYHLAGESNLIDLELKDLAPLKVLVKNVQYHPVKGSLAHVDLYKVNMKKEISTTIPLHFIGESKAVQELNGDLNATIDEIEVSCLPGDLISFVEVDLSKLNTFDDVIKISDLNLPDSIKIEMEGDEIVASVSEHKEEVVKEPVEEEASAEGEALKEASTEEASKEETKE